ncbi:MAG: cyclic nucleotide-binding domain-containing protein [Microthrixaceae bacterium]
MTEIASPRDLLRKIPLFAECTPEQLDHIDHLSDGVDVHAGAVLAKEGTVGKEFAVIVSGSAIISREGKELATLGPGDYFGEIALIDGVLRTATVTAAEDSTLEVLDRRAFRTLLDDFPAMSRTLLQGVTRRLAELADENEQLRSRLRHPTES